MVSDDRIAELAALADNAASAHEYDHQVAIGLLKLDDRSDDLVRLADALGGDVPEGAADWKLLVRGTAPTERASLVQLDELPAATFEVWTAAARAAESPRVRARLHDLLFSGGRGDRGTHARNAIDAYVELAEDELFNPLWSTKALCRAMRLARMIRDDAREHIVGETLLSRAALALEDPSKPGVFFRLLEPVAELDNSTIDDMLERARSVYPGVDHVRHTISIQRTRTGDESRRRELDRELIQALLDEADRSDALVAIVHRTKAVEIARDRGQVDLAHEATIAMQSAEPPKLERIEIELPQDIDETAEKVAEGLLGVSWWETVRNVLAQGPPSGTFAHNEALAREVMSATPLRYLFPNVRLGGDGLPRYTPETEGDRLDDEIVQCELLHMRLAGGIMSEALLRAGKLHRPTADEIAACFDGGSTAHALGRAVVRFNEGDPEAAAFTALPLVERTLRDLLLSLDEAVYRLQRQRTPGQYAGLGALLTLLADRELDESWHRFLRSFLCAPNGLNFRNEVLHGFVDGVPPSYAGLVLIAEMYLLMIKPRADDKDGPDAAFAEPA